MLTTIGVFIGIILSAIAVFFKSNLDATKLAKVQAQDTVLKQRQAEVEAAIKAIDDGIAAAKAAREKKIADDNMTLKDRAANIKKGLT